MLRADNVICGTSTTGTGTLTLAACPAPPGGIDPYAWLTATGYNGTNGGPAFSISYTVIEYTDATFATAKAWEKGIGTITIGASLGATTLSRDTIFSTGTSLNSSPAPVYSSPTAISIGTAANVLVFVGASALETLSCSPYIDTTQDGDGAFPLMGAFTTVGASGNLASNTDYYVPFLWGIPKLVKQFFTRVQTQYSGGTPVSNAYARIYDIASSGKAGNLLYDFGLIGSAGSSLNSTGVVQSGSSGNGFLLMPGEYFIDLFVTLSGGTTAPQLSVGSNGGAITSGGRTTQSGLRTWGAIASATGGSSTAPATAATTGWNTGFQGGFTPVFTLK